MIKAVLVGTGDWAMAHAEAYRKCKRIHLAGICGHSNADKARDIAQQYGIEHDSLDLHALLHKTQPELLDVAGNPHYRLQAVQEAVQHDCIKLINLEKPIALMPEDAYEIAALCRKHDKLLTINHQKKFLPAWQQAHAWVTDGTIGELQFLRASCQGNVLEQGTHLVDMLLHFNQYAPAQWVMGQIGDLDGFDKDGASAPDSAIAVLQFRNGVRASLEFGTVGRTLSGNDSKWFQFAVEAYGTEGHVKIGLNQTLQLVRYADGTSAEKPSSWSLHYVDALAAHLQSLESYMHSPASGHISDLAHSLASFEIIMAIYASGLHTGRIDLPRRFDNGLIAGISGLQAERNRIR